jgi:UDP-glucose 4-epimerase
VTGGAGLIGKHLVDYLIDVLGHEVIVVENFSNSVPEVVHAKATIEECDLAVEHERTVAIVEKHRPDIIFHAACHPYEGLSQFNPVDVTLSTHVSTLHLLVGATKAGSVKRFVYFSSMARYGSGHRCDDGSVRGPPFEEDFIPNAEDVYASAKIASEECVRILCNLHNIEWSIVVPHNVYGEANDKALSDPYRGFLLIWVNNLLRNKPFYIYGDGEQQRAPSYVTDTIPAIAKMGLDPKTNHQTVNIGARQHYSINETAKIVRRVFTEVTGMPTPEPIYTKARPCEVKYAFCTIDKSIDLLGYEDKTSLEEGVRKLTQWAWKIAPNGLDPRYLQKYEIVKQIPETWEKKLI